MASLLGVYFSNFSSISSSLSAPLKSNELYDSADKNALKNASCKEEKVKIKSDYKEMKELIKSEVIQNALGDLSFKDIRNIQRLPSWLFKAHAYSAGGFICYIRSKQNKKRVKG